MNINHADLINQLFQKHANKYKVAREFRDLSNELENETYHMTLKTKTREITIQSDVAKIMFERYIDNVFEDADNFHEKLTDLLKELDGVTNEEQFKMEKLLEETK